MASVLHRASTGRDIYTSSIPPCIQTLSLNHDLFITESAGAAIPSFSRQPTRYPFPGSLSLSRRPLHFPTSSLFPLSSPSLISPSGYHAFSRSLKAQISPLFHLPLCSSFTPSFNNLLTSITRLHLFPLFSTEAEVKFSSVIGQRVQFAVFC